MPKAGRRAVVPTLAVAALAAACLAGCSSGEQPHAAPGRLPQADESARLDPADFTVDITNKYWPMSPGHRWVYEETDGDGTVTRDVVSVLDRTKKVDGIEARVVHDIASVNGETVEDTTDWYAQDSVGNVWYLGEQTAAYRNGRVTSTGGSWEAGVDGAQPGIAVPAEPRPGTAYRQEYYAGRAEDQGFVFSTSEQAQTPAGLFEDCLMTRDTSPLEPRLVELKWYAAGVGPVLTLTPSGENSREVLVQAPGD